MFDADIYVQRRENLKKQVGSGVVLFIGNSDSPMNYADNQYLFRQDSSFLYFWGLDYPSLAAVIDIDDDKEIVFGDDLTVDDIVWMGPQPTLQDKSRKAGVKDTAPLDKLETAIREAVRNGRKIHYLPQYRAGNILVLEKLLGIYPSQVNAYASAALIKAVVAQRNVKSAVEIEQIEQALDIAYKMQTLAMKMAKPGVRESEIAGAMEGLVLAEGGRIAFPVIFSIHGETLHNHFHGNIMKEGDMAVNDSGAETGMHYASDITRTIPVSGAFMQKQRDIYEIVLKSQLSAIDAIKPGVQYRDVHLLTAKVIAGGLRDLGLMKGNIDAAVEQGAHALFFPHGVGHMMGLDVHDMENLGENYVGYDEGIKRSEQFGLAYLRLAKELIPGYVLTVEPGIYFIPELIDMWKSEKKFKEFINYKTVEKYRDFGGIRIEDDVLVTENGHRVLGKPIPKTVEEVESACS